MPYYEFHTLYHRCVLWNMQKSNKPSSSELSDVIEEMADRV